MKRILKGKFNLLYISFLLLTFYPLLKYNYSSIILIVFLVSCIFTSVKNNEFSFSKHNIRLFVTTTLFFILLAVSVFYSANIEYAFKKITQLIPLLIVPFVIIFFRPNINKRMRTSALNLFMIVNLLYSFAIIGIYLLNKDARGLEEINLNTILLNYDKVQFDINNSLKEGFFDRIIFFHKPYFSMGFVISSLFALHESIRFFKLNYLKSAVYILFFSYFSFLVIYAFSFPNVIALVVCIVCLIILKFYNSYFRKKTFIISGLILLSLLFLGVFYKSQDLDVKRGINFIKSVVYQENIEGNDPRIEIYKSYFGLFDKASLKEIMFGYGIGDAQDVLRQEYEDRITSNKTKNLLLYNEEFNNGYWHKTNINVLPNQTFSIDQLETAEELILINTEKMVSHNISKDIILEKDSIYTLSVFAKEATSNFLILRLGKQSNTANFNIHNELVTSKGDGIINASIINTSGQWYRCSITIKGEGKALAIIGLSNQKGEYVFKGTDAKIYLWGAQIEKNEIPTPYQKNNTELIEFALNKNFNTHNNFLFLLMSGGILCLFSFLMSMFALFYISIKNKNILQLSFCIILGLNFLTENILSRHWGLMFVSMMLIILFTNDEPKNKIKRTIA